MLEEGGSITYDEVEERIRFLVREYENDQEVDVFEIILLFMKVEYNSTALLHIINFRE